MANEEWFYFKDDQKLGPVTAVQLRQLASSGQLLPTDKVLKQGWAEERLASTFSGLFKQESAKDNSPPRRPPQAIQAATQAAEDVSQKLWFLDLQFEQFATPRLIGFVFIGSLLLLVLLGVGAVAYAIWTLPVIQAVLVVIAVFIELVIFAICLRVFLECCLVGFRIAEHLSNLRFLKPLDGTESNFSNESL